MYSFNQNSLGKQEHIAGNVVKQSTLAQIVTVRPCSEIIRSISQKIMTNLACTDCSKEIFGNDEFNYFLDLTKNKSTQKHYKQNENLTILLKNLETHISTSHKRNCNETSRDLNLDQNPNILFLKSDIGMKVSLSEAIDFMQNISAEL